VAGPGEILCIVPARGGSKRFARKNVALLGGRPLIAWTIAAARDSGIFDRVWVSSDDAEILDVAVAAGAVPLVRRAELAGDTATVAQVCAAAAKQFADDGAAYAAAYVLLPTSPLRSAASIRAAWARFADSDADALMSVQPLAHPPEWALAVEAGCVAPADRERYETPRKLLPQRYRADGAHSIVRTEWLIAEQRLIGPRTLAFASPVEEAVDIDTPQDLAWAEFLLARRRESV